MHDLSFLENLTVLEFQNVLEYDNLRNELAHQLVLEHFQIARKNKKVKVTTDQVELKAEMDRIERYYGFVLRHTGKDYFTKHLKGTITIDQYVARISEQTGGIKYRVLDDIVGAIRPEILQNVPIVEKRVKDMALNKIYMKGQKMQRLQHSLDVTQRKDKLEKHNIEHKITHVEAVKERHDKIQRK